MIELMAMHELFLTMYKQQPKFKMSKSDFLAIDKYIREMHSFIVEVIIGVESGPWELFVEKIAAGGEIDKPEEV
jgi:hypothetical protein